MAFDRWKQPRTRYSMLLISQYTDNFEGILRLAVINLLFIMDNSQCGKDFSLMFKSFEPGKLHAGRRMEAIHRIAAEWNKALDTKMGKRRVHVCEPVKEASELLVTAAAASVEDVAAEAVQDPYKLMSIDDLFAAADLVHLGHHCLDCRDRLVGEDAVQALCDCQPLP